jgi:hypothetical protein
VNEEPLAHWRLFCQIKKNIIVTITIAAAAIYHIYAEFCSYMLETKNVSRICSVAAIP